MKSRFVKVRYPNKSFEKINTEFIKGEKGIFYLENDIQMKPGERVGVQVQYTVEIAGKHFEDGLMSSYGLMKNKDVIITTPSENYKVEFFDFHEIRGPKP